MNEITQANATAQTAFGWRNGLGAAACVASVAEVGARLSGHQAGCPS